MTSYLDEALVLVVADVRAGRLVPASEASSRPEVFVAQTAKPQPRASKGLLLRAGKRAIFFGVLCSVTRTHKVVHVYLFQMKLETGRGIDWNEGYFDCSTD